MRKIQLWSVGKTADGHLAAEPVEGVDSTETEQDLEDLLVESPSLLMENLTLIGRQLPTEGGPLDLLGVDNDGRIVVFELKRGILAREAVAQVLDYGSDLGKMDPEQLARLVEEHSGRNGIEELKDFADWHRQQYPNAEDVLSEPLRMVLVGLGVDDRARRIVNFLAESGIDIQLVMFNAFRSEGRLLLARQVESESPSGSRLPSAAQSKEGNRQILHETAAAQGVRDLLEEVAAFVDARVPAYRWPGKTAYSFSLQEETEKGRPSSRAYLTLYVNPKERGSLLLIFPPRAVEAAGQAVDEFCSEVETAARNRNRSSALELSVTSANWNPVSTHLAELLSAMVSGWKARSSASPEAENG